MIAAMWDGSGTVVTMTHADFDTMEVYTVTVTAAGDLAGHALVGAPYEWSFETVYYRIYLPLVLR